MDKKNEDTEFRNFLNKEFNRKKLVNPKYSIRSFALFLGIHQSHLTRIMNGSRPLTVKMICKLGEKLEVDAETLKSLSPEAYKHLKWDRLDKDQFQTIADWYHFAIIELFKTKDFSQDIFWMSRRLGISAEQVHQALLRMERLGIVAKDEVGKYKVLKDNNSWYDPERTSEARRAYYIQTSQLDQNAVLNTPFEQRRNFTLTVATSSEKFEQANNILKKCCMDLDALYNDENGESSNLEEVYQLNIGFFPLTGVR